MHHKFEFRVMKLKDLHIWGWYKLFLKEFCAKARGYYIWGSFEDEASEIHAKSENSSLNIF
jgi:hypothetical protein